MKKFKLGKTVMTQGVNNLIMNNKVTFEEVMTCLAKHSICDWGDIPEEDKILNDEAITNEQRIVSGYKINATLKIWVITEWDRSYTTILLPSEY